MTVWMLRFTGFSWRLKGWHVAASHGQVENGPDVFFRSMWFDVVKPQQSDFNALLYRMSQTKKRKIKLCFGTCCHVGSDNEVFRMAAIFAWALICVQCKFETLKKEQISNFWNVPKTQKTQQASFESCCMMWEEILPSAGQGMVCLWIWFGTICSQSDRGGYALSFSCIRWLCVVMEWACHCHSLRWISGNSVVMVDFLRQRQGNSMSLPARALGLQEGYSQERCFRCFFFMFSELLLNGWQFLEVATKRCCSLRCLLPSCLLYLLKKTPFVTLQNLQNPGAMGSLDEFRAARGPEFTSSRVPWPMDPWRVIDRIEVGPTGHRGAPLGGRGGFWEEKGEENHRQTHSHIMSHHHFDGDIVQVESVSGENTSFFGL